MEIAHGGIIPLGNDFFGSLWFLRTDPNSPDVGGAVVLVPVQECYIDPDNPVEHMADSFEDFLRGLERGE